MNRVLASIRLLVDKQVLLPLVVCTSIPLYGATPHNYKVSGLLWPHYQRELGGCLPIRINPIDVPPTFKWEADNHQSTLLNRQLRCEISLRPKLQLAWSFGLQILRPVRNCGRLYLGTLC